VTPRALNSVEALYGATRPPLDDPAEAYHAASKFAPCSLARSSRGVRLLERHPELLAATRNAAKRAPHRPGIPLTAVTLPAEPLGEVIAARRSARAFGPGALELDRLAALLQAAYGVTGSLGPLELRSAPSGGGLYPLELYVVTSRVTGAEPAVYHFDLPGRRLEHLGELDRDALVRATLYPDLVAGAAALVAVTAMFWRTRVKYGLRGYRFALLEAGHVGQNLLLAATALGLASLPLAGLYDARVEELLGVDGVDESLVHAFCIGPPP
jgi:SagB-type dehydrogenase family enzyme